jgi:DNA replication and repair protein RecF
MYLEKLSLLYFKNHSDQIFEFSAGVNLIVGLNGVGKTNLLDAIHCLCLTRSFLATPENQLLQHEQRFFSIVGTVQNNLRTHEIKYSFDGKKKIFEVDQQSYSKISQHLGRFPIIVFTPFDTDLIRTSAEERRKFFDSLFCQSDMTYLLHLSNYQNALKQRNALLKQVAEGQLLDYVLLDTYDQTLIQSGTILQKLRNQYIADILPTFNKYYNLLSPEYEECSITYMPNANIDSYENNLKESLQKDLLLQRTNRGIHKDDFDFTINGHSIKNVGSQGQQKSFMIALKLAQFDFLKLKTNTTPLLLLDDIFDKLDDQRIQKLIRILSTEVDSQLFVTDARPERSQQIFEALPKELRIFNIEATA